MTIRDSFIQHFGEENATRLEEATLGHMGNMPEVHRNDRWGDDPFRYMILAVIGYECVTKFREYHGITMDPDEFKQWVLMYADLHLFEGDFPDYLALMAGAYYPWIDWDKAGVEPPESWVDFEERQAIRDGKTKEENLEEMRALTEQLQSFLDARKGPSQKETDD